MGRVDPLHRAIITSSSKGNRDHHSSPPPAERSGSDAEVQQRSGYHPYGWWQDYLYD